MCKEGFVITSLPMRMSAYTRKETERRQLIFIRI